MSLRFLLCGLFCAPITPGLLSRILGALDAPFGPIVANRGEADADAGAATGRAAVGGEPTVAMTITAASTSVTLRRVDNAVQDWVGAFPSARSVACSITSRT